MTPSTPEASSGLQGNPEGLPEVKPYAAQYHPQRQISVPYGNSVWHALQTPNTRKDNAGPVVATMVLASEHDARIAGLERELAEVQKDNLALQERLGTTAVQLALSEHKVKQLAAHNDGYALLTRAKAETYDLAIAERGRLREDAERMRFLRNGGWEVLQNPRYWTAENKFDGAIDQAMAEVGEVCREFIDDADDDPYCTCPVEHDDHELGFNNCSACGNRIDGSP